MTLKQAIAYTKAEIKSRQPKTLPELRNCVDAYICLTCDYTVNFVENKGVQLVIPGRKGAHILPSPDAFYVVTQTEKINDGGK